MRLRQLLGVLLVLAVAGCSGGSTGSSAHAASWSLASLNGQCIWHAAGVPTTSGMQNGKGPFSFIAAVTFDGRGSLTMNYHLNLDGAYSVNDDVPGSYTVDPDGHGTLTYTSPATGSERTYDFFITPHGKEIKTIYHGNGVNALSDRVAWGICRFPG